MKSFTIRIPSRSLVNALVDLRYTLPDSLISHFAGMLSDGGYDYDGPDDDMLVSLVVRMLPPDGFLEQVKTVALAHLQEKYGVDDPDLITVAAD